MSWRWRVFNRARMFVDRIYLTAIFLGPWQTLRAAVPFGLGVFFTLKLFRVINSPSWVTTLGTTILLAHAAESVYRGRKLNARYHRGDSEARPPP